MPGASEKRNSPAAETYRDGAWVSGDAPLFGAMTHAAWLGSSVFDGARVMDGAFPDLLAHCERVVASAGALGLKPPVSAETLAEVARDGAARFEKGRALYVRPIMWAEQGGPSLVAPDPESTAWAVTLFEAPLPSEDVSISVTLSPFRRPTPETMPTDAKAGCLYPNGARMLSEARARGFDNALTLDTHGNVAELATANVFMVRGKEVLTPAANGCFLAGITRARVMALLAADGWRVREARLTPADFEAADEIFSTGNYGKVVPVTRYEERTLEHGAAARRARALYWDWALG